MNGKPPARTRPIRLAALVAAPAIAAVLCIAILEGYRAVRPDAPLFTAPLAATLAEAIQRDDIDTAFALIRGGQDPNRPIEVRDEQLTGGRAIRVSPLLLAVATRNNKAVRMLLAFGARTDLPPDSMAACLADAVGDEEIAGLLRTVAPFTASQQCAPMPSSTTALLLAFVSH
jgi:hypothetical protein